MYLGLVRCHIVKSRCRVRRVDRQNGTITAIAGDGRYGFFGDNVPANATGLANSGDITIDAAWNLFIADSTLYNDENIIVGRASGNFMKSKVALTEEIGYK